MLEEPTVLGELKCQTLLVDEKKVVKVDITVKRVQLEAQRLQLSQTREHVLTRLGRLVIICEIDTSGSSSGGGGAGRLLTIY